jgi:D-alanyl-D-alanine carboxypeptidase (penicillin-binding protein 5/6)
MLKGIVITFFILLIYAVTVANADIDAPSAVVVDAQTGKILYGKNPHLKLPPASTTKLVTVMVALEKLEPEQKVLISKKSAKTPSVSPKLIEGEVYKVRDLIYLALMRSVNSAAVALAEATSGSEKNFVKLMNEKVQKIGAKDTRFINASGLPGKGQYTTVYDLTRIMSSALVYPLIKDAINTRVYLVRSEDGKEHFIQNTNHLLWSEDNMIGGKTGYTRNARHCFVSASRLHGRLVYTAILGDKNREKLWEDTQQLLAKADNVLSGKDEPIVTFSEEESIKPVSYKSNARIKTLGKKKVKSKVLKDSKQTIKKSQNLKKKGSKNAKTVTKST